MYEQQKVRRGGIEGKLDYVGKFYMVVSIIGLLLCLYISQDEKFISLGLSSFWIGIGFGTLAQGTIFWILFQAAGEVIRLLKKLNQLSYGGEISKSVIEGEIYLCSDCGAPATADDEFCSICGGKLDDKDI